MRRVFFLAFKIVNVDIYSFPIRITMKTLVNSLLNEKNKFSKNYSHGIDERILCTKFFLKYIWNYNTKHNILQSISERILQEKISNYLRIVKSWYSETILIEKKFQLPNSKKNKFFEKYLEFQNKLKNFARF